MMALEAVSGLSTRYDAQYGWRSRASNFAKWLWAWLGAGEEPGRATLLGGTIVLAALAANELVAMRRPTAVSEGRL